MGRTSYNKQAISMLERDLETYRICKAEHRDFYQANVPQCVPCTPTPKSAPQQGKGQGKGKGKGKGQGKGGAAPKGGAPAKPKAPGGNKGDQPKRGYSGRILTGPTPAERSAIHGIGAAWDLPINASMQEFSRMLTSNEYSEPQKATLRKYLTETADRQS